jgi:hypothetical protein
MSAYRYRLVREWGTGPRALWGMLNPSVATEENTDQSAGNDDPTTGKCRKFSVAWGCGSMEFVNLFALQATDPIELTRHVDPVGPLNDWHIEDALSRADVVIAAWGASYPKRLAIRPHKVGKRFRAHGALVLGFTKNGDPRHPLFVPDATTPVRWAA